MTVLTVGATLAREGEAERLQQPFDVTGFQDRDRAQDLADLNGMGPDKLRLERRFTILQQEPYDFLEVSQQLVYGRALRVRARPAGDMADKQVRIGIALDDGSESAHSAYERQVRSKNTPLGSGLTSTHGL